MSRGGKEGGYSYCSRGEIRGSGWVDWSEGGILGLGQRSAFIHAGDGVAGVHSRGRRRWRGLNRFGGGAEPNIAACRTEISNLKNAKPTGCLYYFVVLSALEKFLRVCIPVILNPISHLASTFINECFDAVIGHSSRANTMAPPPKMM